MPNGKTSFQAAINDAGYYSDRLSARARPGKRFNAMTGGPTGNDR